MQAAPALESNGPRAISVQQTAVPTAAVPSPAVEPETAFAAPLKTEAVTPVVSEAEPVAPSPSEGAVEAVPPEIASAELPYTGPSAVCLPHAHHATPEQHQQHQPRQAEKLLAVEAAGAAPVIMTQAGHVAAAPVAAAEEAPAAAPVVAAAVATVAAATTAVAIAAEPEAPAPAPATSEEAPAPAPTAPAPRLAFSIPAASLPGAGSAVVAQGEWDGWVAPVPVSVVGDSLTVALPEGSVAGRYHLKFRTEDGSWHTSSALPAEDDGVGNGE